MSTVFELDAAGWDQRLTEARLSSVQPNTDASATEGVFKGIGEGVMRGGAKAADAIGRTLLAFARAPGPGYTAGSGSVQNAIESPELSDPIYQALDETTGDAVNFWTPNAQQVGKIGQVLGGLSEIVLPLGAAGGNPALLVGSQEVGQATELTREGVDTSTALGVGLTAGLSTAVGFKLPFLGSTLAKKIASGALGNLVTNTAATAEQRLFLQEGGYDQLAENYDPLNVEARAVDVLTGVAFGTLAHVMEPSQRIAVAAAGNAKHYQLDTSPGIPADNAALAAHQRAMDAGTEALMKGEKVVVPPEVLSADFIAKPERVLPIPEEYVALDETRAVESVKTAAADGAEGYDVAEGVLTDEQLAAFQGLRSDVQADQELRGSGEGAPAKQGPEDAGRPRGEPLKVYRGAARELIPEDFKLEALGHATGHPSSGLGVFFSAHAAEAARYGKLSEHYLDIHNPKVILAEDLPGFDSAAEANAFRQQLEAEGFDGMVIDASHLGGPVNYVAFTHEQVLKAKATVATSDVRLQDPRVRETLEGLRGQIGLDEKGGKLTRNADGVVTGRTSHVGSEVWMNRPATESGKKISAANAHKALDNVKAGKPLGAEQQRFIAYALDELDNITHATEDYVNEAAAGAHEEAPEIIAARQYLEEADLMMPTGEIDADGSMVTRSAREIMAEAAAEIAQAENDGKGYEAAVSCWLTRGADAH